MVGKSNLPDGAAFLFLRDPLLDTHFLQRVPCIDIVEHMHQIIVDVVRAQTLTLLVEEFIQTVTALDQIIRKLGGNMHLLPHSIFLQHLTQYRLAAGVDIGGVKIIDTLFDGKQDLFLCLCQINSAQLLLEAHTAETQNRKRIPVSIHAVVHCVTSLGPFYYPIIVVCR